MRIFDYISIAVKDVCRQYVRSLLTIVALIISTVILVIMVAISVGSHQAVLDQFGNSSSLTGVSVTPNQNSGTLGPFGDVQQVNVDASKLDDATITKLAGIPHVRFVYPNTHIWEIASLALDGTNGQFVAQASGVPRETDVALKAGRQFATNDESQVVILGYAYAKALGYGDSPYLLIGKTLRLTTQKGYRGQGADIPPSGASEQETNAYNQMTTTLPVKIIGVTDRGFNQNALLVSLGWAHALRTARYNDGQQLKAVDQLANDGYTTIHVTVDSSANVESVTAAIQRLGYSQVSTLAQVERLQQYTTMVSVILGVVAVIAIIAAALGVVNTMLMTVAEQEYVIGIWRACGARKRFIMALFLVESGLLGFTGGMIGSIVGIFSGQFINQYINSLLGSQGFVLTNIATVPLWLAGGAIGVTTAFSLLAGFYPAYQAARQDPSHALTAGQ